MRRVRELGVGFLAVCVLSGCVYQDELNPQPEPSSASAATQSNAVRVEPEHGTMAAWTDDPLHVLTDGVTVTDLMVQDSTGAEISGTYSNEMWIPDRTYLPSHSYTVTVRAAPEGSVEEPQQYQFRFRTVTPEVSNEYRVMYEGATAGIGTPLGVVFETEIADPGVRAKIESNIDVRMEPEQVGSWGWSDNWHLYFRPQNYWLPNTNVTMLLNIGGIKIDDRTWIAHDASASYLFEPTARVVRVDEAERTVSMLENDVVVGTLPMLNTPVENGSRSGTKVVIEKFLNFQLSSGQLGILPQSPKGWELNTRHAQRLTWTGEFIHSVGTDVETGQPPAGPEFRPYNGIALSETDASTLYDFTRVGTPVEYRALGDRTMNINHGLGCWTVTFDEWRQLSALV